MFRVDGVFYFFISSSSNKRGKGYQSVEKSSTIWRPHPFFVIIIDLFHPFERQTTWKTSAKILMFCRRRTVQRPLCYQMLRLSFEFVTMAHYLFIHNNGNYYLTYGVRAPSEHHRLLWPSSSFRFVFSVHQLFSGFVPFIAHELVNCVVWCLVCGHGTNTTPATHCHCVKWTISLYFVGSFENFRIGAGDVDTIELVNCE